MEQGRNTESARDGARALADGAALAGVFAMLPKREHAVHLQIMLDTRL